MEILSELPGDTKICLSSDPEGNSYDWVFAADFCHYTEDDELRPLDDDEVEDGDPKALFLWP